MKTFSGIQMVLIWMLAMCIPVYAGLGDLDLQTQRYGSLIASDTGEAQTIGVTVIAPVDLINGGAAVTFLRTSILPEDVEEAIVSDDLQYRLQGGPVYKGVSLQFFIDGDWGQYQDRGAFIRPGVLMVNDWRISGGVGTYLRGLEEELRLDADDPETLLKPLAFASISREIGGGSLSVLCTWSPTFDFDVHDLLIEPQFTAEVGKVNLTVTGRFGQQHGLDIREYQGQVDIPF